MGSRRERRLRRARRVRVGVSLGAALTLVAGAVAIASLLGAPEDASAGTDVVSRPRRATTTTTTLPPTTTTTRPAVNPAYPPAPPDSGTGRRIIYCNSCQRVWLMEDDTYAFTSYLVSGRRYSPSPGTYSVFRKLENGYSKKDPSLRLPWFVGFTYGSTTDIGFHGIPLRPSGTPIQSDEQLGRPLSAGCVRQQQFTAKVLYDWAPMGTTVVVTA